MKEIDRLVKMANQIADNFSFHEDVAERIADHLKRFWAPPMRRQLVEYHAAEGDGLKPDVQRALRRLTDS